MNESAVRAYPGRLCRAVTALPHQFLLRRGTGNLATTRGDHLRNGDITTTIVHLLYHESMSGYHVDERPLSAEEYALCNWLIAHGSPTAGKYAPQLERATVASRCTCGCPSVDLAVGGKHTVGGSEIIGDAEGLSPEGLRVGVILHCREGQLSELEVYPIDPPSKPFRLPKPEALTSLLEEQNR
jgi:hypothetical protein